MQPYWGKLTVRNDRGDRGNVGIIRSPIRASILPDLTTAWECRRFECEREALAYAEVYARLPNAEAVVAYAYAPEDRKIIFEWSDAE